MYTNAVTILCIFHYLCIVSTFFPSLMLYRDFAIPWNAPYSTDTAFSLLLVWFLGVPQKCAVCMRSLLLLFWLFSFFLASAHLYWLPKMSDRWKMTSKMYIILFRCIETRYFCCANFLCIHARTHFSFFFTLIISFYALHISLFFLFMPWTWITFQRRLWFTYYFFLSFLFRLFVLPSSKMSAIPIIGNWPLKMFTLLQKKYIYAKRVYYSQYG